MFEPFMLRIKRIYSENLRNEVYALRYRAYRNTLEEIPNGLFVDEYDSHPNHILWALSDDDEIIGSIRTTWANPLQKTHIIPEMLVYGDFINQLIPRDVCIASGNRFAVEPSRRKENMRYMMLLLRVHIIALLHLQCDWVVTVARTRHVAFYRDVLNHTQVSEGRAYPGSTCAVNLLTLDFKKNVNSLYQKSPILIPKGSEHILLDDACQKIWETGVPIEL
jgi:N-acyl-L-homoserine lactone synthetase